MKRGSPHVFPMLVRAPGIDDPFYVPDEQRYRELVQLLIRAETIEDELELTTEAS